MLVGAQFIFGIIGLVLAGLWTTKKKLFFSKQTLIFIGFSSFSLLVTLWAKNPILHHFGVPILGEGSVIFFGLALLSLGLDNAQSKIFIYWSAIIAAFSAGFLVFLNHPAHGLNINSEWLPYVFGAFLAPLAAGLFAISTVTSNKKIHIGILILCALLLYLSHNKTSWVAVFVGFCFWVAFRKVKYHWEIQKYLCAGLPFLSLTAIYILPCWFDLPTLYSRKLAIQTYILSWCKSPLTLLYGNGWGYYFENLQKNITKLPVKFFHNGVWSPDWDGVERLDFHSMHLGAECLFSIGFIGVALYVCLILAPYDTTNLKKNSLVSFIFTVLFGCLTSTWFTLVCTWPFFILGFSILVQNKIRVSRAVLPVLWLFLAISFCFHGAFTYWKTAILYPVNKTSLFYNFISGQKKPTVDQLKMPFNYRGYHLGHSMLNDIKKQRKTKKKLEDQLTQLISIYDPKLSPLVLDVAMLHAMKYFKGSKEEKYNIFDQTVNAVILKAPDRPDLIVPYINELIENGELEKAKNFITRMPVNNPFTLWLQGIYDIHTNSSDNGKSLMRGALSHHIDDWIFIPKDLIDKLSMNGTEIIKNQEYLL